jgi:hypothetical protein
MELLDPFRKSQLLCRTPKHLADDPTYHYDSGTSVYQNDARIDSMVNAIVRIIGFLMLAAPLWILFYIPSRQIQLAIITGFIAVFLGMVQSVTIARPFESLAATAA